MKILFYIIAIKLTFLLLIYYAFFIEHKQIKLENNSSDMEVFMFKTFVIDSAVTGM